MRDEDVRFLQREERFRRFALQIANDAAGDVLNVERPFAQIGIVDLAQGIRVCVATS